MKDINGVNIFAGDILIDSDCRKYFVTKKEDELYANSLFEDCGCGKYLLYQERVDRNGFKVLVK